MYAEAEAAYESAIDVNAFCDSPEFMEGFGAFLALMLEKVARENPEKFVVGVRAFMADARAAEFARRYQEEGVRISYGEAVELARGLMWMRTPYRRKSGEQRPADELPYIYDYEILAAKALMERGRTLCREVVERSKTEKLVWDALQECVKSKLRAEETVEGELRDWALDVPPARERVPTVAGTKPPR